MGVLDDRRDSALVRASIPKSSWSEIQRSPDATRDKIVRVLGPTFESELNRAVTVSWVPFAIEARMADAVFEALGPVAARAFYRAKTANSFDFSWLRPLISSAMRLFGTTPNSLLKMLPRAWSSLSKDCGSYDFIDEGKARRGVSLLSDFPITIYRDRDAWLESAIGGYEAMFTPFGLQGSVTASDIDVLSGKARFTLTW